MFDRGVAGGFEESSLVSIDGPVFGRVVAKPVVEGGGPQQAGQPQHDERAAPA
jgi:hypothetical protein